MKLKEIENGLTFVGERRAVRVEGSGAQQEESEAGGECVHSWRLFGKFEMPETPEILMW